MKRFRFATIHLVMIGLILFGILAICVRLFQTESAILAAIFLALSLLVALLYYQKENYELSELEQIELLNNQTEAAYCPAAATRPSIRPIASASFTARLISFVLVTSQGIYRLP